MADYLGDPKVYGDVEHCGWTTEEEEDYEPKRKEETSSNEDEVPLPQPGDMHVEFKKSSLPNRAKKPKIECIPFHLLQENKQELCKRILWFYRSGARQATHLCTVPQRRGIGGI